MEDFLDKFLEDHSLEEIFENLNVEIYDAFEVLFEEGMIDEQEVKDFLGHE